MRIISLDPSRHWRLAAHVVLIMIGGAATFFACALLSLGERSGMLPPAHNQAFWYIAVWLAFCAGPAVVIWMLRSTE